MRKYLYCFFIGLLAGLSAAGQGKDTTFILRETGLYYHAVFIERDTASSLYGDLASNRQSPWDSAFYNEGVALLKRKVRLSKHPLPGLATNWHPLQLYKGQYYVYYPSDGTYNNWIRLTDSTLLEYAGGEMLPYALHKVEQGGSGVYTFSATFVSGERCAVQIHLLDVEKGMGLFKFKDETGMERFQLMVATNKMKNFPLIVNYCKDQKQDELEFDLPDYELLLKKSGKINEYQVK